jgi:hypothetical protein
MADLLSFFLLVFLGAALAPDRVRSFEITY